MRKMTGKMMAVFLVFGILMSSTPGKALAAEETRAATREVIETFEEEFVGEIFVNGEALVKEGAICGTLPEGMSIDFASSTITLRNCTINGYMEIRSFTTGDTSQTVTFQLEGNNTINGSISSMMKETIIRGDGILNINPPAEEGFPENTYYAAPGLQISGNLTMYSGNLNIVAGNIDGFEGIRFYGGDLIRFLGGKVNIQCGDAPQRLTPEIGRGEGHKGISSQGADMEIADAEIRIDVGEAKYASGLEILSMDDLQIKEDGTFDMIRRGGGIKIKNASVKIHGVGVQDLNVIYCGSIPTGEGDLYCYLGNDSSSRKVAMEEEFVLDEYGRYVCDGPYIEFSSVEHSGSNFTDVTIMDWFYDPAAYVSSKGLMMGLNPTTFGSYDALVRAQFAVILHRMNGEPKMDYTAKFKDVQPGLWYTDAVLWANSIGVVNGYSDTGLFGTADNINREQMAVMMYRYANYEGYDVNKRADLDSYTDVSLVHGFAKDAMSWAVGSGIITGKDNGTRLDPQGYASRAECATIIMRFMEIEETQAQ